MFWSKARRGDARTDQTMIIQIQDRKKLLRQNAQQQEVSVYKCSGKCSSFYSYPYNLYDINQGLVR